MPIDGVLASVGAPSSPERRLERDRKIRSLRALRRGPAIIAR